MSDAIFEHAADLGDDALPIGTALLGDQFTITAHLGAGGFGITYHAKDNVLGRTIVIKECFPADFCIRDGKSAVARNKACAKPMHSIVKMFMHEARSLAKLRHPNIVGVHRAFEENETAYMALDLIDGYDLFDILEEYVPPLSPDRVKDILLQLLNAVEEVHEIGLLHRDISPDNILIEKTGTPVLIDFGAARADSSRHTRAVSSLLVVKDGYSPHEFYIAGSDQTPSSDLYALAATFYHLISDEVPTNSQTRMLEIVSGRSDPCTPLAGRIDGYDEAFLRAIDSAMQIHPGDRLQSAAEWRDLISEVASDTASKPQPRAKSAGAKIPRNLEISLSRLVEETNDEVRRTSQVHSEPEPVVAPRERTSKLEWIEEFNQEALAPAAQPDPEEHLADLPHDASPLNVEAEDEQGPRKAGFARNPVQSKSKWVDRARQKEARQRSRLLGQSEPDEDDDAAYAGSSAIRSQTRTPEDWQTDGDAAQTSWRAKAQPIGVFLCLILSVYLVATFEETEAIKQSQSEEVVKPKVNSIEMIGNIIR